MDWGNAIVRSKTTDRSGQITSIDMDLHLDGDFRKTKKKITWLSQPTSDHPLIDVTLLDYDYLITKKKLEENDDVADFVTPVSEFKEEGFADANVKDLTKGDIMQFERKGYFIFDGIAQDGKLEFILIPDGKAASLASKAGAGKPAPTATAVSKFVRLSLALHLSLTWVIYLFLQKMVSRWIRRCIPWSRCTDQRSCSLQLRPKCTKWAVCMTHKKCRYRCTFKTNSGLCRGTFKVHNLKQSEGYLVYIMNEVMGYRYIPEVM